MTIKPGKLALAFAGAAMLTVAGCGGGGGAGGTPAAPVSAHISGTAAAGLPLVGSVTVKDAKGVTKSVPLSDTGAYEVDVSDMTAPFLFRAEGTVGGRSHVIHSAATAADANGTINITPLTDLIVSNIAGQLAENYFNSGNFSTLTKAELDSETAGLKAKLLPLLTAMGVDASIDLLRTAFTPLSSALDKVLDILNVSIDPASNVATITNLVTQQQISDDLKVKAAAETATTPLSGTGMATAADDLTLIRKALSDFSAKFATGSPTPGELLPLMTSTDPTTGTYNFRHGDATATQFANRMVGWGSLVGGSFTDVTIRKIDYAITSSNTSPRAFVEFTIKNKDGIGLDHQKNMQLVKGTDGTWRLRGDGRVLDTYGSAHMVKNGLNGCVTTGLEFGIQDPNTGNSGNVAYVVVTGPGLPAGGLKYQRSATGDQWALQNTVNQNGHVYYQMASNCKDYSTAGASDTQIAAIPDDAAYTLTAYDSSNAVAQIGGFDIIYTERIPRRPLTLAEAVAATFPSVTTSTPLDSYTGGNMTISATGADPARAVWMYLGLTDLASGGTTSVDDDVIPDATGSASKTLNLSPVAPPFTHREIRVESHDVYWRNMQTVLNYYN